MVRKKQMNYGKSSFAMVPVGIALLLFTVAAYGSVESQGNANLSDSDSADDMPFMLLRIQADVQGSLNDLDLDLSNATQDLSATGLAGDDARDVLSRLMQANSNLVEVVTFGKDGSIIIAECKGCEGGEGADISSQEHISHVLKAKTATFSKQFLLVEGFNGTALAYPVFSPQGDFLGGISAIIEPDKLLNAIAAPLLNCGEYNENDTAGCTFWAMDLDGLLLCDEDSSQVGRNLFEDPLYKSYPSLLDEGHRIATERSGHGYYSFQGKEGNKTAVDKECYWTTAGIHNREWRLVVTEIKQ
jgi:polar amino acid transport system substrate-binding protein